MNSEIKVALPSQKLNIKGCIQQANTSVQEWSHCWILNILQLFSGIKETSHYKISQSLQI